MAERGVYFTNEPLAGVEFRLILEYSEPVIGILQSCDDSTENINEQPTPTLSTIPVEDCTFRWQQKLHFGRNKLTNVSETQSCLEQDGTDQDELTTRVAKEGSSRVFTLVDGEKPTEIGKITTKMYTHMGGNRLAEKIMSKNKRIGPAMIPYRKLIIDLPHKEHQIKTRSIRSNKQMMHIMAYLGPVQDNTQISDESNHYVLCKITAINETNIIIEPDLFSTSSTIESRYGIYKARLSIVNNEKFDRVDNASSNPLWFEKEESRMISDFLPQKTTKFVYLIDIERAINFPHDGLYIEYEVDLPLQCALIDISHVHEWSPITDSSPQGKDDIAVFSQPVCLTFTIKEQLSENFYWPKMIFRLCGEDYWGRFFVDGFGQLTLPPRPGRYQFDIKCWRYKHKHDRRSMLFENFISEIADFKRTELTPTKGSATYRGSIASTIGFNVINSGILKINVQCIMQSQEFISHEFFYRMKYGALMRHNGMQSRIHWDILKVLSRFEEARKNLLKIRNQLIPRCYQ
ncbi:Tectonic-like complex member MKS1 [Dirofilaria immitis]